MDKVARTLLFLGGIWMLILCVLAYFALGHPRIATKWKQEPPPPEPFSLLRLGEAGEVLAETPAGHLYEYVYGERQPWQNVIQPSGAPALGYDCVPRDSTASSVPPPGSVKSWLHENCVYAESNYYFEMVLLENGEVWSWQYEVYAYTQMAAVSLLLAGFAAGTLVLALGAGLKIFQKVKKNPDRAGGNPSWRS